MISNYWIRQREVYWERLEFLLRKTEHGIRTLNGGELQELGLLYRQIATDLATVSEDAGSRRLADHLNQLLGRSHNLLYQGEGLSWKEVLTFFTRRYPAVFRQLWRQTALAAGLFFAAALAGWALASTNPAFVHLFLGPQMMESIERRRMWTESVVALKPVASSFITTNNLTVAFSAFALGITGIGTIWMMAFNGLLIGVVGEATARAGMAMSLWSFVAPHGVLELPAIWIAGGAGFELARGLLFPGFLPRRESLTRAGRQAVRLMLGCIPLLLMAGLIEAFFSPTHAPVAAKFVLAAVLFCGLLIYLFGAGGSQARKVSAVASGAVSARKVP